MSNLKAAQDVHHKLEFYLVALAFTTAAFATQTGRFSGLVIGDMIELLSWVLFVLSGVLGLMRLEYLPVAYRVHDYIGVREQSIREHEADEEQQDDVAALRAQVADNRIKRLREAPKPSPPAAEPLARIRASRSFESLLRTIFRFS
jgi:hypothetical protein